MCLFRNQFNMRRVELKGIQALTAFHVIIYTKAWRTAHFPSKAPKNAFDLMKHLLTYSDVAIRNATTRKLSLQISCTSPKITFSWRSLMRQFHLK